MSNGDEVRIIRVQKNKDNPYVMIDRRIFSRETLSLEARGLLGYLLSKPDNWQVRDTDLMKIGAVGRDKLRGIVNELKEAGYVRRLAAHDDRGRFVGWQTFVYEDPEQASTERLKTRPSVEALTEMGENRLTVKPTDDKSAPIINNEVPLNSETTLSSEGAGAPTAPCPECGAEVRVLASSGSAANGYWGCQDCGIEGERRGKVLFVLKRGKGAKKLGGRAARKVHPAVAMVKSIRGALVPSELHERLIEVLGDRPNFAHLKACWLEWKERGYNPQSWKWVTEWYPLGIPDNTKQKAVPVAVEEPEPDQRGLWQNLLTVAAEQKGGRYEELLREFPQLEVGEAAQRFHELERSTTAGAA